MKLNNSLGALKQVGAGKSPTMVIELQIKAAAGNAYQLNEAHCGHHSFPFFVDAAVWQKALTLDCGAIAEANTQQPGCIFHNWKILQEIERRTAIAAHGVVKTEVDAAKRWLDKVCKPRSMQTDRPLLAQQHFFSYPYLYEDIVVIRGIQKKLGRVMGVPPKKQWDSLKAVFPDLQYVPADWLPVISHLPDKNGDLFGALAAADWVLGQITHYSAREIRKIRGIFWPAKDWGVTKKIRDENAEERIKVILETP